LRYSSAAAYSSRSLTTSPWVIFFSLAATVVRLDVVEQVEAEHLAVLGDIADARVDGRRDVAQHEVLAVLDDLPER
jgi:hypothetical protein